MEATDKMEAAVNSLLIMDEPSEPDEAPQESPATEPELEAQETEAQEDDAEAEYSEDVEADGVIHRHPGVFAAVNVDPVHHEVCRAVSADR